MRNPLGTMIRCADVTEKRLAFYHEIGLDSIQIAGVYESHLSPSEEGRRNTGILSGLLDRYELSVPSMFLSYPAQNWSDPKNGVGLTPEGTRTERMILSCRQMNWAKQHFGTRFVLCHVGWFPEEDTPPFDKIIAELKLLADFAEANGQMFLFETGDERVADFKNILKRIGSPATGVNFDPANLLIYNRDDPAVMIREMRGDIRSVHCKDARRPVPGDLRGRETVLGKGDTRFGDLLADLLSGGFDGPLVIERELPFGPEQEADVREAVGFIKGIMAAHS